MTGVAHVMLKIFYHRSSATQLNLVLEELVSHSERRSCKDLPSKFELFGCTSPGTKGSQQMRWGAHVLSPELYLSLSSRQQKPCFFTVYFSRPVEARISAPTLENYLNCRWFCSSWRVKELSGRVQNAWLGLKWQWLAACGSSVPHFKGSGSVHRTASKAAGTPSLPGEVGRFSNLLCWDFKSLLLLSPGLSSSAISTAHSLLGCCLLWLMTIINQTFYTPELYTEKTKRGGDRQRAFCCSADSTDNIYSFVGHFFSPVWWVINL